MASGAGLDVVQLTGGRLPDGLHGSPPIGRHRHRSARAARSGRDRRCRCSRAHREPCPSRDRGRRGSTSPAWQSARGRARTDDPAPSRARPRRGSQSRTSTACSCTSSGSAANRTADAGCRPPGDDKRRHHRRPGRSRNEACEPYAEARPRSRDQYPDHPAERREDHERRADQKRETEPHPPIASANSSSVIPTSRR